MPLFSRAEITTGPQVLSRPQPPRRAVLNPTPVTKFVMHWQIPQAVMLGLKSHTHLRTGMPLRLADRKWAQGGTLEPHRIRQHRGRAGAEVLEASP